MATNGAAATGRARWRRRACGVVLAAATIASASGSAQEPVPRRTDIAQAIATVTPGQAAVFRYANRPITVLRATVLSRSPQERAAAAAERLDRIIRDGRVGQVSTRVLEGVSLVSVGGSDVFGITPLDVDTLVGETQESKTAAAIANLQRALDETIEARTPYRLLQGMAMVLLGSAIFGLLLWGTLRLHRTLAVPLLQRTERQLERLAAGDAEILKVSRAHVLLQHTLTAVFAAVTLFLLYSWLTFSLRRFPYTRPWGESLRAFLFDRVAYVGGMILTGIPDLFTVLLILLLTRFAVRIASAVFQAVEEGRVTIPYVYPETAAPTRRLVSAVFWLLGIILAYPHLPGSDSDAFKGVSVFVGLVLSLGSSGIVNQMMSGLTITYSRAVRAGDFVKIGDIEGTVTHLGTLSTKVKTPRGEEVTIPNAVVMSDVTINYSRFADTEGVFVPTSLTIGYDVPWRQIHALLLMAAERTPGVRLTPAPVVRQTALQDFYVQYTLLVCVETPQQRLPTLDALHASIQDAFNEYGVQIMSPNYEADPEGPKIVPRDQWYAAPAKPGDAVRPQVTSVPITDH
jgi:small-conductance mechanosensitive channel